jgi:hypothetical protein
MVAVACNHRELALNFLATVPPSLYECGGRGTDVPYPYPLRVKLLALWPSLRGVSMRRIGRLCQCSTQPVLK